MNKNVKNEVVNEVVTMVKQIVAIVAVLGATYVAETAVVRHETEFDKMIAKTCKNPDRGQRGRDWCAWHEAGRGRVGLAARA